MLSRTWPLGCNIETYPGRNGHTRLAKIQCGTSTVVRPIHKQVPLHESYAPVNVKPQGRGAGHTSGICHLSLSRGWGIIKHLT